MVWKSELCKVRVNGKGEEKNRNRVVLEKCFPRKYENFKLTDFLLCVLWGKYLSFTSWFLFFLLKQMEGKTIRYSLLLVWRSHHFYNYLAHRSH